MKFIKPVLKAKRKSLEDIYRDLVDESELKRVSLLTPDRREFSSSVANFLGVEEEVLLHHVAAMLEIPFLERIEPFCGDLRELKVDLETLHKIGAAPVKSGEIISGIACVDPLALDEIFPKSVALPRYIATWQVIKDALSASSDENDTCGEPGNSRELPEEVLGVVLDEAASYDQHEVRVIFTVDKVSYAFNLPDGKFAEGQINRNVGGALFRHLKRLARNKSSAQSFSLNSRALSVEMAPGEDATLFIISNLDLFRGREVIDLEKEDPVDIQISNDMPLVSRKVIVVDDNETFSNILSRFLSKEGVTTICVSNGVEALEALSQSETLPELVVCDVHMPGMDGFEFIERIRQDLRFQGVPIVMLTSDNSVKTELRLIRSGADAFIGKDEDPRLLSAHIQRILGTVERGSGL